MLKHQGFLKQNSHLINCSADLKGTNTHSQDVCPFSLTLQFVSVPTTAKAVK